VGHPQIQNPAKAQPPAESLWPIYKDFVEQYKFYALSRYGKARVAYGVIADLVKTGWRDTSQSTDKALLEKIKD